MFSKFKLLKDETGQAMVMIALLFVVLLGFAAIAIDIGRVTVAKSHLQNAADAAALAGVRDLPDTTIAKNTAVSFAGKNGVRASDVTVTYPDSTKIEVICTRNVEYTFARVLGFTDTDVSARAVAQISNPGGVIFDFAVFAGAGTVSINGNGIIVGGDVYGRDGVSIPGKNNVEVTGNAYSTESGRDINNVFNKSVIILDKPLDMPDFSDLIKSQGIVLSQSDIDDIVANGKTVDGPIYVEGDITINGRIPGTGIICASGKIDFSNDVQQEMSDNILFYSATGNIEFNGGSGKCVGIFYAPNGYVTINGNESTIYGRIIAREFRKNGGNITIISNTTNLESVNTITTYRLAD